MMRDDLFNTNAGIVATIAKACAKVDIVAISYKEKLLWDGLEFPSIILRLKVNIMDDLFNINAGIVATIAKACAKVGNVICCRNQYWRLLNKARYIYILQLTVYQPIQCDSIHND